jgi:hypothetical protein
MRLVTQRVEEGGRCSKGGSPDRASPAPALNEQPAALSSLIGLSVRDADGKTLGHVFELRAYRDGDGIRLPLGERDRDRGTPP